MKGPFFVTRLGPKGPDTPKHTFGVVANAEPECVRLGYSANSAMVNGACSNHPASLRLALNRLADELNRVFQRYMAGEFHEEVLEAGVFMVTRDCCLSGNCSTCMAQEGHVYGDKVRVCQFITTLPVMASKVAKNFAAYNSRIEDATDTSRVDALEVGSAAFVREKLQQPERINSTEF